MKEMMSRVFVVLVTISIIYGFNQIGEYLEVLYFHVIARYAIVVAILAFAAYFSIWLRNMIDQISIALIIYSIANSLMVIFFAYVIFV
ncbi:hypothetical protein [Halalkalibacillus halophilus]|uniref:hypothetical protein n=1 Tax=Halalkalibacillus halophilus TaxID=392827 RepID=UPI0003FC22B9|nr:hypothetical protein [Halalkalibacillus halophilus]